MYQTRNDLPAGVREKTIAILDTQLADLIDLRTQAKLAHWNVRGRHFVALHDLFDDIAAAAGEYADTVAERATQLGGIVHGTARQVAATSELPEYSATGGLEEQHVTAMADALAAVGSSVRRLIEEASSAGDDGTADVFTEVSRGIDKWLWMVEAYLQEEQAEQLEPREERATPVS